MAKVTQKQLIDQLRMLKDIKPRQEWAVLLKSQIFLSAETSVKAEAKKPGIMDVLTSVFFQKRLAYSLATILILVAGVFGIMKFLPLGTVSQKSTASLTTGQVASPDPKVVAVINSKIKDLTQALKDNPEQTPQAIQGIAASLKTLADVPGANLTANPEVQDLYKTVVANQILDLQKTTLTDDQQKILSDTVSLYNAGKYSDALEEILLISK